MRFIEGEPTLTNTASLVFIALVIGAVVSGIIFSVEYMFSLFFDLNVSDFFSLWKGCTVGLFLGVIAVFLSEEGESKVSPKTKALLKQKGFHFEEKNQ